MNPIDKPISALSDIRLGDLLERIALSPELPLVFNYEGARIRSGYHVTEVKAGQFSALDCGANPESWSEIFVQLWDVDEEERTHMTAGKFSEIVRKVSEHLRLDGSAKLTFEVSDGLRPMQLFCANAPLQLDGLLTVALTPRAASCKPRDRWLADETAKADACCTPAAGSKCCA
jgi:hypothetical protein